MKNLQNSSVRKKNQQKPKKQNHKNKTPQPQNQRNKLELKTLKTLSKENKFYFFACTKRNLDMWKVCEEDSFHRPGTNNWKITHISTSLAFIDSLYIRVSWHLHKNQWHEASVNRMIKSGLEAPQHTKIAWRREIHQFLDSSFNIFINWITVALPVEKSPTPFLVVPL